MIRESNKKENKEKKQLDGLGREIQMQQCINFYRNRLGVEFLFKYDIQSIIITKIFEMETSLSLFDQEINKKQLIQFVRSNKRKGAVVISKDAGAELVKKINQEFAQKEELKAEIQSNVKLA